MGFCWRVRPNPEYLPHGTLRVSNNALDEGGRSPAANVGEVGSYPPPVAVQFVTSETREPLSDETLSLGCGKR